MTDTRILIKIARKWNKVSSMRRRISARDDTEDSHKTRRSSPIAGKGQFTVYTVDRKRFTMPLRYLDHGAIRELFDLSEEEYGLQNQGPITLPCDAAFMEGLVRLIRIRERSEFEKSVLCVMSCVF
ncbi:hypothetical protein MLD38_023113 [Melastoma candidum]|uniref:Uncharacterized protein n=1 Tax=Melastoma candidum TaxID=119954 RepID=A0ACB9QMN2_9MYRT|nr:hypothetical protein MLD38_023113 [Melastoma candidum]